MRACMPGRLPGPAHAGGQACRIADSQTRRRARRDARRHACLLACDKQSLEDGERHQDVETAGGVRLSGRIAGEFLTLTGGAKARWPSLVAGWVRGVGRIHRRALETQAQGSTTPARRGTGMHAYLHARTNIPVVEPGERARSHRRDPVAGDLYLPGLAGRLRAAGSLAAGAGSLRVFPRG